MTDQLFDDGDLVVEVPMVPEPRRRRGAAAGVPRDARFLNEYPPEWEKCAGCGGDGRRFTSRVAQPDEWAAWAARHPGHTLDGEGIWHPGDARTGSCGMKCLDDAPSEVCPDCLGMGSLKARVRLEAGHRCVRCKHPWIPKGDAKMLNALLSGVPTPMGVDVATRAVIEASWALPRPVERSGMHPCPHPRCLGGRLLPVHGHLGENAEIPLPQPPQTCPTCKGEGKVWENWSPCTAECTHDGPVRITDATGVAQEQDSTGQYATTAEIIALGGLAVEAAWRILTVHHLDGDKANVRWWNLVALCQRCHLEIQGKVVMERVYPYPHSEWFKPYVAGYYAFVYLCRVCGKPLDQQNRPYRNPMAHPDDSAYPHLCEPGLELTREQVEARMDELLGLELQTV